jgi:D-alanyl-lipoteichoic acid acyltransferase DltB (MBOAT superfamily)
VATTRRSGHQMTGDDLLQRLTEPVRAALGQTFAAAGAPPGVVIALVALSDVATMMLLASLLARGAMALRAAVETPAPGRPSPRRSVDVLFLASGFAACPFLWWILHHRSAVIYEVFTRWDHLTFATLAGCALSRLPSAGRTWSLVILSLVILAQYGGRFALAGVLTAHVVVFAALHVPAARRTGPTVALHAGLIAFLYTLCWWLRPRNPLQAIQVYGLFSFLILRQISVAVAMRAGNRPSLRGYLCYLSFYPSNSGLLGGPEVYDDFARRNLGTRMHYDYPAVAAKIARGALQVWFANRFPVSFASVLAASTMTGAWVQTLLLFVSTALKLMGIWAMIEANALLFGFRLQPNFVGILTRTNPSELWWAYRGTFTNWLVRYVYGPLGANRRHQALNILAAFGVSWSWHVLGLPFLTSSLTPTLVAPITFWAILNASALIAHLGWQRRGWTVLPPGTPERLRRGTKMGLTWLLAAFNVAPLQFQIDHTGDFWRYLLLLTGVHR